MAAAVAVAADVGLPAGEPVLLHEGANAVVHLHPAPVVARVALTTARARPRPEQALAREVALARWAAGAGAPAVPPTGVVHPGPHVRGGWAMSLWPLLPVPPDGTARVTGAPEAVGAALAALHEALAPFPAHDLPGLGEAVGDAVRCLDAGGRWLPAPLVGALREAADEAVAVAAAVDARGDGRALHGDPHPGNLLRVGAAALWVDMEEAMAGPVEWDLAVARHSRRHDGAAAVRAYASVTGVSPDGALLDAMVRLREWQGHCWTVLHADAWPQRQEGVLAAVAAWALERTARRGALEG